ncbi:unnamed protein product [Linum trigynum]|uniref:t-SNARE coiled-coil homology domain-containing protein n=1 Tax=Linum trigynum TaxID=586398 RepID=A0AAV2D2D1_9ROSI
MGKTRATSTLEEDDPDSASTRLQALEEKVNGLEEGFDQMVERVGALDRKIDESIKSTVDIATETRATMEASIDARFAKLKNFIREMVKPPIAGGEAPPMAVTTVHGSPT